MVSYSFLAKVWIWQGNAGWHFVTLPTDIGKEIKANFSDFTGGFGSIKVTATVGESVWNTSIFPDKESGSYLLPLKAEIRKAEHIQKSDTINVNIKVRV